MKKYFNVLIELDHSIVDKTIDEAIQNSKKGYVCCIESNNLTIANKNDKFKQVLNNSLINVCDGSNIAWLIGKLHHCKCSSYPGPSLFINYIKQCRYKHFFLGNTPEVLGSLKSNLSIIDKNIESAEFISLPFCSIDKFDYKGVAEKINKIEPDIIWVSLGAPKQELFIANLLPFIKRGIMFGIGAAFNFNSSTGKVKRAPLWMRKHRLEWLHRAFEEPSKNIPRYWNFIKLLPLLIQEERKNAIANSASK